MQLTIQNQNFTHQSADGIQQICRPLFHATPINACQFIRQYNDGARIQVGSDPYWIDAFLSRKLYLTGKLYKNFENYKSGFYIRDHWSLNSSRYTSSSKVAADDFNYAHGISIIRKNNAYCDFFEMAVPKSCSNSDEFYHAHIDLLDKFSDYFLQKASSLITKAEQNKFFLEYPENFSTYHLCQNTKKGLLTTEKMGSIQQPDLYLKLNKREKQILAWLFQGKTLTETAQILGISIKTIEKIIPKLKTKLNCTSLFQLGAKSASLRHRLMLEEIMNSLT